MATALPLQPARSFWRLALDCDEALRRDLTDALYVSARRLNDADQEKRNTAALIAQVQRPLGSPSVAAVIDRLSMTRFRCS